MSLESVTEKSFLQSVRNNISLKLSGLALLGATAFGCSTQTSCDVDNDCNAPYICAQAETNESYCTGNSCDTDSDCPPSQICESLECVVDGNQKSKVETHTVGGIPVSSGFTNAQGRINFWDSQSNETVNVFARKNGISLANAYIVFEDGDGFEVFHGDFQGEPYFHIFEHNSAKDLDWNTLGTVAEKTYAYTQNTNFDSLDAAIKYSQHQQKTSTEIGCLLPKDVWLAQDKRITAVIDLVDLTPKVGSDTKKILTYTKKAILDIPYDLYQGLVAEGIIQPDECKAYKTWHNIDTFKSQNINVMAAAELHNYKCLTSIPSEDCYDSIDNDCDGLIDKQDSDCNGNTCVDECSYEGKQCLSDTIVEICKRPSQGGCIYKTTVTCESGDVCSPEKLICVEDTGNCEDICSYEGKTVCYGNSINTCGNYDKDDCLEWKLTSCGSGKTCKDGACVDSIVNPTCTNECNTKGQTACESSTKIKTCGDYDTDNCLEWKIESCYSGDTCNNGTCESKPQSKELFYEGFGNNFASNWNLFTNGGTINTSLGSITMKPKTLSSMETKNKFTCNGEVTLEFEWIYKDSKMTILYGLPSSSGSGKISFSSSNGTSIYGFAYIEGSFSTDISHQTKIIAGKNIFEVYDNGSLIGDKIPSCTSSEPCEFYNQPIKIICEPTSFQGKCALNYIKLTCK
ncbi:hypothetical protein HQ489_01770 [Candidatus Woesearchaeota archaeon]|nr:hypothetical protein [Candidatus Woesearchaeota archaeon]